MLRRRLYLRDNDDTEGYTTRIDRRPPAPQVMYWFYSRFRYLALSAPLIVGSDIEEPRMRSCVYVHLELPFRSLQHLAQCLIWPLVAASV